MEKSNSELTLTELICGYLGLSHEEKGWLRATLAGLGRKHLEESLDGLIPPRPRILRQVQLPEHFLSSATPATFQEVVSRLGAAGWTITGTTTLLEEPIPKRPSQHPSHLCLYRRKSVASKSYPDLPANLDNLHVRLATLEEALEYFRTGERDFFPEEEFIGCQYPGSPYGELISLTKTPGKQLLTIAVNRPKWLLIAF